MTVHSALSSQPSLGSWSPLRKASVLWVIRAMGSHISCWVWGPCTPLLLCLTPGMEHLPISQVSLTLASPVSIKYSWQPICCLDSGQGIWWVHCSTVLWDTGIHSLQESGCCYWNHRDSANGWFENGPYGYSPDIQTLGLECWLSDEKSLQLQPLYLNWIWAALQGCRCSSSTPPHTACIL